MLSLQHLKTFLTVVRFRSFTRAAIELQLTQPAVSAHIAALESTLGTPLLIVPAVASSSRMPAVLPKNTLVPFSNKSIR